MIQYQNLPDKNIQSNLSKNYKKLTSERTNKTISTEI